MNHSEAGRLGWKAAKATVLGKYQRTIDDYNSNPNSCLCCSNPILHSEEGRERLRETKHKKFCDQSCAAKYNNRKRRVPRYCMTCNVTLQEDNKKFCSSKCFGDYTFLQSIEKIKAGEKVSVRTLKKYLIQVRGNKCSICHNIEWMEQLIPLIMDHIDGNSENEVLGNLRLICPNCDAQLPTYKGKNKGNGRHSRRQRYKEGKSY